MSEPSDAPQSEIEASDEGLPAEWLRDLDAAVADYEAGRFVACDPETFDRLLTGAPYQAEAS
ncbi:hypothetical protein [Frankia sp. AiPa1]|uniref:hypothetical protein n=1 Tax=Frankia sp. AiPa1 TaxID=573492 RepID=UPI00202B5295|nr:hypothetical protein [Frankia sp. AiPa1]MCL9760946.1 hypothetical protein [Frankia sp. AiPa1]